MRNPLRDGVKPRKAKVSNIRQRSKFSRNHLPRRASDYCKKGQLRRLDFRTVTGAKIPTGTLSCNDRLAPI